MELDIFIKGELVDLCIPTAEFIDQSRWHTWFNDPKTSRYLEQGIFPNTKATQRDFFEKESASKSRLILIISDKEKYIGTVSLSMINHEKKTASIAIVIGEQTGNKSYPQLVALESMARMLEHGFSLLGLMRIEAGQHWMLKKWEQRLELLGFQLEGIRKNGFIKGIERADSLIIAVTQDEYLKLKKNRRSYWDSAEMMNERVKNLPEKSFYSQLSAFFSEKGSAYYEQISSL